VFGAAALALAATPFGLTRPTTGASSVTSPTTIPEITPGTGGIGHNLPQEAPRAFTQAIVDVATMADA
jgi:hypothetical protein